MTSFNDFPLREELKLAVSDLGFETPTPIQQKTIPLLLEGSKNIVGLAQTGTGKTAAFGLPLLQAIDVSVRQIQGLVLSPTRELCMQIENEFIKYGTHFKGFKTVAVYGGVPISGQMRDLRSSPQVIVATPGRLIDLLERKAINLENVKTLVLDEADEMLNMGFRDDINFILSAATERQQTWLFSATMNNDVRNIAKKFMKDWQEVSVAAANATNENIDHQYYVTQRHLRFDALQRLLDFNPGIYGIIFTRTRQDCQDTSERLMKNGYHASPLHGDMDQKMRSKVLERFKSKSIQLIVATDVAARGIDVNDITHVINLELPDDPEVYTHRSGRTARAGKSGICMSIVTPKEISSIRQIERLVKNKFIKCDIPDGAEVIRKRLFHQLDAIEAAEPEINFAEVYQKSIHERFENMDKDVLIQRLLWLQLKDTISNYGTAQELNAGFANKEGNRSERPADTRSGNDSVRMYINLGSKDGLDEQRLLQFLLDSTDMDVNQISRVTVKELSSYFNVPFTAKEFLLETLPSKKFKSRKIRIDEAERPNNRNFASGGGGPKRYSDSSSSRPSYNRSNDRGGSSEGGRSSRGGSSDRKSNYSTEKRGRY